MTTQEMVRLTTLKADMTAHAKAMRRAQDAWATWEAGDREIDGPEYAEAVAALDDLRMIPLDGAATAPDHVVVCVNDVLVCSCYAYQYRAMRMHEEPTCEHVQAIEAILALPHDEDD